ncbi:hypothetical protein [Neisseria sp. Ec49-e6-T10]|uniref:hypothetical protein n=1 Tax=Neisseria sp. Ec49-e6-T10 TaxID=3140744 RepID=UPI003EBAA413
MDKGYQTGKLGTQNQEEQLTQLIEQCLELINEEPTYRTIKALPQDQPHPQIWNIRKCEEYFSLMDDQGELDQASQDINTLEKKRQIEDIYKKIYLVIFDAGLMNALNPSMPWDFGQEFSRATGFMDYQEQLSLQLGKEKYRQLTFDDLIKGFFGSREKMEQSRNDFFQQKVHEYHIGED